LAHLPSAAFAVNEAWLSAVLIAGDLLAWLREIGLAGQLRGVTAARLRYPLLPEAGRLIRTGRRVVVRVAAACPWSGPLLTAVTRCAAAPRRPVTATGPHRIDPTSCAMARQKMTLNWPIFRSERTLTYSLCGNKLKELGNAFKKEENLEPGEESVVLLLMCHWIRG
jgi:hypothetical protein